MIGGLLNGEVLVHAVVAKVVGAFVLLLSFITWHQAARNSEQAFFDIIRALILGSVVFTIIGMVEFFLDVSFITERFIASRFSGGYFDPNHYGALTGVGLVLLASVGKDLFPAKLTTTILTSILVAGLLLSISRGAWVATAIGLAVVVIKRPITIKPGLILFGLAAIVAIAMSGVIDIILEDINERPDNVSHRLTLIQMGFARLKEVGYLGIGLSVFLEENEIIIHNSAIWMLVEMGGIGLLLFLLFIIEPVTRLLRLRRDLAITGAKFGRISAALLAAHILMSVASMNVEATYQRQWWLILALTMALLARSSILVKQNLFSDRANENSGIRGSS
jgi:O-antigen ligase